MEVKKLQSSIEAILFASGDPVSVERIADVLSVDKKTVNRMLETLVDKFESDESGICIIRLDDSYQMCSKPQYGECIRQIMDMRRNVPLSPAAMEVLAIVAYNQPVTRAFVDQIRGVDSAGVMASLSNKGLIEEKGRLELPGRPLLYGTTSNFLRCFGIESVDELPPIPEKSDNQTDTQDQ